MEWFVFAMISVGTLAVSNLLQRVLMKDKESDPIAYGLAFQWICATLVGIYAFWNGFVVPPIRELPLNFVLMALLYGFSTILILKALKTIEASEATILASSRAVWTILVALIFLGETFSIIKLIGTLLIFIAIFLVSYEKRLSLKIGSFYVLAYALLFGVAVANDTYIIRQADVPSYLTMAFLLPGFVILAYNPSVIKKMKIFLKNDILMKMILLAIFYSISAIAFYLAYQSGGNVSQIAPINQSVVIVTVILAAIFLKERKHLIRKIIAAFFVSIGVLLLR